jgi:hypothetical protein
MFFWTDSWLHGSSLERLVPTVFAAVRPRKRRATVADALAGDAWVRHLAGAFSLQFFVEFADLCDRLEEVHLSDQPDTFVWGLTADSSYTAASAYGGMFFGSSTPTGAQLLWKTAAPPHVRFFFWLVMHDRCWTAARRFRHGLQDSDVCILCDQASETMDHLLLGCVYNREVWHLCLTRFHLHHIIPDDGSTLMEWWTVSRKLVPKQLRRGFDSLFFLAGWCIWKERNARMFRATSTCARDLASIIFDEFDQWCLAGNRHLRALEAVLG